MAFSGSLEYEHTLSGTLQEPTSLSGELSLPATGVPIQPVVGGKEEIYIGGGDFPDGYKMQIIPDGEATGIVEDVKVNGESIVENGVANIPIGSNSKAGLLKGYTYYGINVNTDGTLMLINPTDDILKGRRSFYPLTLSMYDKAVKNAMCDGIGTKWTTQEKANARNRLGLDLESVVIDIETTEEVKVIDIIEHDGKPLSDYDFKQMWVFVESVGGGNGTTSEIITLINGYKSGVIPYLSTPNGLVNNSQKVYWSGYLDVRNGLALSNTTFSLYPYYRVNTQMTQSSYMLLFENNINKVTIQSNSTVIPIGTKFKVVLR